MPERPGSRLAALGLWGVALGCSTDTSGLARRAPEEMGGAGGGTSEPATPSQAGAGGTLGSSGRADAGRSGPSALTFVHGLVDGGNLFICFRDPATGAPLRGDRPEPSGGLPYGGRYLMELDGDAGFEDVRAELLALVPGAAAQRTCSELLEASAPGDAPAPAMEGDAGADAAAGAPAFPTPPRLPRRVGDIVIAASTLRAGGHYVLVASGCATAGAPASGEICGLPDAFSGSLVAFPFVELGPEVSQPEPFLGLQFLNASRALASASVTLQAPTQTAEAVVLASEVPFGALRPRTVVAVEEPVGLALHAGRAEPASHVQSWDETSSASDVAAVEPGRAYLLVYVGPDPRGTFSEGVAPPRFVLVPR